MTVEDDYVDYWELSFNLYKAEPELILAKVWWRAGEARARGARQRRRKL